MATTKHEKLATAFAILGCLAAPPALPAAAMEQAGLEALVAPCTESMVRGQLRALMVRTGQTEITPELSRLAGAMKEEADQFCRCVAVNASSGYGTETAARLFSGELHWAQLYFRELVQSGRCRLPASATLR